MAEVLIPSFSEHFWGEKNNGFEVMYQNMKSGLGASKEFSEFLKESCSVEESYNKTLTKLAKSINGYTQHGSFGVFWQILKALTEKLASLHLQLVHSWQELSKEVQRYSDEQHRKHRAIKDKEIPTLESMNTIQSILQSLQKSKETYHSHCFHLERLKKDNGSEKDIERVEAKCRKSRVEYQSLIEKYANHRVTFEKKMLESCQIFQDVEEQHLRQMKEFIDTYAKAWHNQHALMSQVHEEFQQNTQDMTIDKMLVNMLAGKRTGGVRPDEILFEEADLTSPAANSSPGEIPLLDKPSNFTGFLTRSRRDKKKKREKDKEKKRDKESKKESADADSTEYQVDAEGFTIRPDSKPESRNSWTSSSDSDSDSGESMRKINIAIRPPNGNMSSTVDVGVLRETVEKLRLSPSQSKRGTDHGLPRSSSESHSIRENDMIGMESSSNGESNDLALSLSSPADARNGRQILPSRPRPGTLTPTLLNGPPSARNSTRAAGGRISPAIDRADSIGELARFSTFGVPIGTSRGPSPLTVSRSDTIPLAVAFTETLNAYFRGSENVQVRLTGEMMISFPAGIAHILNENSALLTFSIKNTDRLQQVLCNRQLVDEMTSPKHQLQYSFHMQSLVHHLKKQAESNRGASYFNVEILKYQVRSMPGMESMPLQLVSYWKNEPKSSEFRLDYKLNTASLSASSALNSVNVIVPIAGKVAESHTVPNAEVSDGRCIWHLGQLSELSESHGCGTLRARFHTEDQAAASPAAVQFLAEGSTVSGIEFELMTNDYRLSLIKKRVITGKYLTESCNPNLSNLSA